MVADIPRLASCRCCFCAAKYRDHPNGMRHLIVTNRLHKSSPWWWWWCPCNREVLRELCVSLLQVLLPVPHLLAHQPPTCRYRHHHHGTTNPTTTPTASATAKTPYMADQPPSLHHHQTTAATEPPQPQSHEQSALQQSDGALLSTI